jgi:tetratricopeptide (TPR) repeat protein
MPATAEVKEMKNKQRATSLLAVLFLSLNGFAQTPLPTTRTDALPAPTAPAAHADDPARQRLVARQIIHGCADRVLGFHSVEAKTETLVALADILWQRGDEDYARELFLKAYNSLKSVNTDEAKESGPPGGEQGRTDNSETITPTQAARWRSFVVQHLIAHDAPLAKRLSSEDAPARPNDAAALGLQALNTADALMRAGQYADSIEFAEQGLKGGVSGTVNTLRLLSTLMQLRAGNEQAANELFLKTLAQLVAQPTAAVDDLLIIGNYVFTAHNAPPATVSASRAFIFPTRIGNVPVQADISGERPGVPAALVRAYLEAAAAILSRPVMDASEQLRVHAASFLLLPKAQRFAPELAPRFTLLAAGDGFVPPVPQPAASGPSQTLATTQTDATGQLTLAAVLHQLDEIADGPSHDAYGLRMVSIFFARNNLDAARAIAGRIQDAVVRAEVFNVLNVRQLIKSLETGDVEQVEQAISKFDVGFERTLLRLGLARSYSQKGDRLSARLTINAAVKETRNNLEAAQQPFMLLTAAEIIAPIDATDGSSTFREAVQAFNRTAGRPLKDLRLETSRRVSVGGQTELFETGLRNLAAGNFYRTLKLLAVTDPQGTSNAVLALKDESVLGQGLVALASALPN